MSKEEVPPVWLLRKGNTLVPEFMSDLDWLERFQPGQRIKVTLTTGRSPAKLRLYWAYLKRVRDATGCAPSPEALHAAVKQSTGFTMDVLIHGYTVKFPRSIAFDKMEEPEFDDYLRTAEEWIISTYGVSIEDAFGEKAA